MIALLTGKVVSVGGDSCILDVNGVGFQVFMPLAALETLSRATETVQVYTHFQLREDGVSLYGFLSPSEKSLFEKIIGVAGVGPKTALAILGTLSAVQFQEAIRSEDYRRLTGVSGVGMKTAQRLVLELKGKLGKIADSPDADDSKMVMGPSIARDAADALDTLGYPVKEATAAVESVLAAEPGLTTPEVVRRALKILAGGKGQV